MAFFRNIKEEFTKEHVLKTVAPFFVAQRGFEFAYKGDLTELHISNKIPTNSISMTNDMRPMVSREYETAYVSFNEDGKNVGFVFNKYFGEKLNPYELAFVFFHEEMHVLLNHGKRGSLFMKTLEKEKQNHRILNIAMDICINEILIREYFREYVDVMSILEEMCTIKTIFKEKSHLVEEGKNFIYYYNKILELLSEEDFGGMTMFGDIQDMPEWAKEIAEQIANSSGMSEERPDGYKDSKSKSHGSGSATKEKIVTQYMKMGVQEAIDLFIKPRNMSMIDMKAPSKHKFLWNKSDRRMTSMTKSSKSISIPAHQAYHHKKKMLVVVYCDVSGSVSSYTKDFLSMIDLIDQERSEIHTYVWADTVSKATKISSDKYSWENCGGGTAINSVINHFETTYKDDKVDAVVVLTDGEYDNITQRKLKYRIDHTKWRFFMTDSRKITNVLDKSVSVEIDWNKYKRGRQ